MCRKFWLYELCALFAGRLLVTPYANVPYFEGDKWYWKFLRGLIFRKAEKIIAITPVSHDGLLKAGIPKEKIEYVHLGVDYDFFSQCPPEDVQAFQKKHKVDGKNFAVCLELREAKQPHVVIPACLKAGVPLVAMGARHPKELWGKEQHHWMAPGTDPFEKYGDKVAFTGRVSNEDLRAAFHGAMMYVNSTIMDVETFCIAAYEAAAAGLPLCVPRQPIFDVFRDGSLFHDTNDVDQLAANIARLAGDPALRKILGENNRKTAARFDYKIAQQKWKEMYARTGFIRYE
jgi:glycosyltransferase involved in cell wall biosynthesis